MNTFRVSSEDTQKVRQIEEQSSIDNLKRKIDNLNASFDLVAGKVPDKQSFDKLPQVNVSDEELQSKAINALEGYKTSSVNKINNDAYAKQQELKDSIVALFDNAQREKQQLDKTYKQAQENIGAEALKRGLQRSSIVINNLQALTQDQIDTYNQIDREVTNKVNAINFQIAATERQKENALNDFDIEYAVKLEEKLSNLRDNLTKQQLEITKYNNEIAKLENDYNLKYADLQAELDKESWDSNVDLMKIVGQYGAGLLDKYKSNRVYTMVKDYLNNFSKDEAKKILSGSDYLKSVLGNKYNTMMGEL